MVQYHTTQVAKECNTSLNTVRNWCKDYGAFLSPGTQLVDGAQRVFTAHDLNVLKYVAQLRGEGLPRLVILERLSETTFPEIEETDASQDNQPLTIVDAPDKPGQTPANLVIASTLDAHARRLEALEQARLAPVANHNRMSDIVLGVLLALGFMVVILLLAVLYGK